MKSILLTTSALVAFAGAAAAEVSFGGSATLGYNTASDVGGTDGFYWDADLAVTLSQELDNGLTASASVGVTIADNNLGQELVSTDYELSLTSETAGLYFGDTDTATEAKWDAGVDGLLFDVFGEDAVDADASGDSAILRGELSMGGVDAALSYSVDQTAGAGSELVGMQFAATATFGNFNVGVAYQDDEAAIGGFDIGGASFAGDTSGNGIQLMGLSAGTTFGGADVTVAYISADDGTDTATSMGGALSYGFGDVTLGAYYAVNSIEGLDPSVNNYGISAGYAAGAITVDASYDVVEFDGDSTDSWAIEGSYDVGNGIMAYAGLVNSGDTMYVAGTYDLGGGASILASYADDGDNAVLSEDIGDPEYQEGMTVEVTFSF